MTKHCSLNDFDFLLFPEICIYFKWGAVWIIWLYCLYLFSLQGNIGGNVFYWSFTKLRWTGTMEWSGELGEKQEFGPRKGTIFGDCGLRTGTMVCRVSLICRYFGDTENILCSQYLAEYQYFSWYPSIYIDIWLISIINIAYIHEADIPIPNNLFLWHQMELMISRGELFSTC